MMSPHVKLALEAINAYVTKRRTIQPPAKVALELAHPSAAFVCVKKHGELRGCIGTIEPTQPTLALEIIQNAISAATRDYRFLPIDPDEIRNITCSVDVLSKPEAIDDLSLLDPAKYGVIVQCGSRRGLLLPDLSGVDTVEDQLHIARGKASISPDEPVKLYRFEVKRFF